MTMGRPSYAPAPELVAVISRQFCMNGQVDLTFERCHLNFVRKVLTQWEGVFRVYVNGNQMFTVKGKVISPRNRRVLYDLHGNPLVTLHQQILSAHRRWAVFRGKSTDSKDLLFSVKKSSFLQKKTKLDVFLASNPAEDSCDFRIEGSWSERSCVIYAGNSSKIIAQNIGDVVAAVGVSQNGNLDFEMHRKYSSPQGGLLGKDTFGVTLYPNVDHAFIVALVVILEEIKQDGPGED